MEGRHTDWRGNCLLNVTLLIQSSGRLHAWVWHGTTSDTGDGVTNNFQPAALQGPRPGVLLRGTRHKDPQKTPNAYQLLYHTWLISLHQFLEGQTKGGLHKIQTYSFLWKNRRSFVHRFSSIEKFNWRCSSRQRMGYLFDHRWLLFFPEFLKTSHIFCVYLLDWFPKYNLGPLFLWFRIRNKGEY